MNLKHPNTLKQLARGLAPLLVILCAALCGIAASGPVYGEESFAEREAKIKAAYLYQFIRYVTWPDSAFESTKEPLKIGIVGNDQVNIYIKQIAAQRDAGNRPLAYLPVTTIEQARECQILFLPNSVPVDTARQILNAVNGRPTLVVSEFDPSILPGGVITFVIVGNNVRLQLSIKTATAHDLKISSQLAKIATVID